LGGVSLSVLALGLLGAPQVAHAQAAPTSNAAAPSPAPARVMPGSGTLRAVVVNGSERIEPDTVRSYVQLSPGDHYDPVLVDEALKRLYATELFADVTIREDNDILTVNVRENPIINRIVFEGNKALKEDKLTEEAKLAPRQIFTRSKVRADVNRIIELYRRNGRFAATIDPKIIQLDQNRVDLVFEITEGPKSKVRQINFIGNKVFSSGDIRGEMATRQARWWRMFTSNDTYDPDRLAYDREQVRQYYLKNGYADFRVVSAVAELTPDRRDFIVTMVVEEGERYRFGKVDLESKIKDLKPEVFKKMLLVKQGQWFNAKKMEDSVENLTDAAGLFGYAFVDIRPRIDREKDKRLMNVTFQINEAPRVYVERVSVNGNTRTQDKVIRREFRLAEGDAFNSFKVKRSKERIQSLGFFQEKLEVEQKPGSTPDKVVLEVNVEEKATGELQIGAGFSSLERFIANLAISERNFMGKGQTLRLDFSLSSYRNEIEVGFTEPYFMNRNLSAGISIFRRDLNSFRFNTGNDRQTTYSQVETGFQLTSGFPLTEYWSLGLRYGLSYSDITLGDQFFNLTAQDPIPNRTNCDRFSAGVFLCEAIGKRTTSSIGYSLVYNSLNSYYQPTAGQRFILSQDFAGLGGVKYFRTRVDYDRFWPLGGGWVVRTGAEAGYVTGWGGDSVNINDRYFLGGPRIRGFKIRGIGPRSVRTREITVNNVSQGVAELDDSLGGQLYYLGGAEIEVPLGSAASELGLRTSAYVDVGSLWKIRSTVLPDSTTCSTATVNNVPTTTCTKIHEEIQGDTAKPRLSIGAGVSWNSPFGLFRIDVAKALVKQFGDEPQIFQFNIGTTF